MIENNGKNHIALFCVKSNWTVKIQKTLELR